MPPKDLPGFYFDLEKNRYFPVKGPLPGGGPRRPSTSASTSKPLDQEHLIAKCLLRRRHGTNELVRCRELHGRIVPLRNQRRGFEQACQDSQASCPMVWSYPNSCNIADSALEQFNVVVQTNEGQKNTKILSMGSASGALRCLEVGRCKNMPVLIWPSKVEHAGLSILNTTMRNSVEASAGFPCSISSIKKIGRHSLCPTGDYSHPQNGLVSTLGYGDTGGAVYVVNLTDPLDFTTSFLALQRRFLKVASFDCTLWTAICSPDGTQAAIGTDKGAALVNLETGRSSWKFHSKSAIFSQQFDNMGNVILCGLRNGSIISVDTRQKQRDIEISVPEGQRSQTETGTRGHAYFRKRQKRNRSEVRGSYSCSNSCRMSSAVCSLVSLTSDDQYFLGSSMDGCINLFDRRLLQRGVVQSYKGHVNSHTHLQLGVNPSETQFVSGGEDCYVRIWNIKTAELLFAKRFNNSVFGTVCWPQIDLEAPCRGQGLDGRMQVIDQSWGAWFGSREEVCYIHGT